MTDAAKNAHEASTGEEAKQEGKYDTRGLEASYLADAQAEQTQRLAESLRLFESLHFEDLAPGSAVALGAIVETECNGTLTYYLFTPCAGGLTLDYEAGELTTLSPDAPMYQQLLGLHPGDLVGDTETIVLDVS